MFLYVFIAGLTFAVVSCTLNYQRLHHVEGPFLAKIGPIWLMYHTMRGDLYLAQEQAMEQHGSPLRIAPDYVVCNDPEVRGVCDETLVQQLIRPGC